MCLSCDHEVTDQLVNYFHHCSKYMGARELFWTTVVNMFYVNISRHLFNLCEIEHTEILFGKPRSLFIHKGNIS